MAWPPALSDWRQAFGHSTTAMMYALGRFGIAPNFLQLKKQYTMYKAPVFQVDSLQGTSCTDKVGAVVRRNCPLSPSLFIIVLSVFMHDVEENLVSLGVPLNTWSVGNPTYDVEYADDTLFISLTTPQLQKFLEVFQSEAARYGMPLNECKSRALS